jgi:hypothetical protein
VRIWFRVFSSCSPQTGVFSSIFMIVLSLSAPHYRGGHGY